LSSTQTENKKFSLFAIPLFSESLCISLLITIHLQFIPDIRPDQKHEGNTNGESYDVYGSLGMAFCNISPGYLQVVLDHKIK
jgi:hypothetical protein